MKKFTLIACMLLVACGGAPRKDDTAFLLARAVHRAEAPFAARLEQARETTMANVIAAAPRPDLIHPGVRKYLQEARLLAASAPR